MKSIITCLLSCVLFSNVNASILDDDIQFVWIGPSSRDSSIDLTPATQYDDRDYWQDWGSETN